MNEGANLWLALSNTMRVSVILSKQLRDHQYVEQHQINFLDAAEEGLTLHKAFERQPPYNAEEPQLLSQLPSRLN